MSRLVCLLVLCGLSGVGGAFSAAAQTPAAPGVVIRERVDLERSAPEAARGATDWTFDGLSGALSLQFGDHPGNPYLNRPPHATAQQCGPITNPVLRVRFYGSREGETTDIALAPYLATNAPDGSYSECESVANPSGLYYIAELADVNLPLGEVADGDAVEIEYLSGGYVAPLRSGASFFDAEINDETGDTEVAARAFLADVGGLGITLHSFYGVLRVPSLPLVVTADPNTVAAGGESLITVSGAGLDPAAPVTLTVSDPALGGFEDGPPAVARGAGGTTAAQRAASVTVPYAVAAAGVRFVAAAEAPNEATTVTIAAVAGALAGTVDVTVVVPVVRLLSQNNHALPESGALVLPSRFRTDRNFPETLDFGTRTSTAAPDPFQSGSDGDLYLLRPELIGTESGATVTFRVRAGLATSDYDAVEGVENGAATYRSERAFRLVTNDVDDAYWPCTPDCPTPLPEDQTLRVGIGDRLLIEALVDGVPVASVEYPVGHGTMASGTPYDPLVGVLNWRWGTSAPNIATAEERASEAWAQASVRFVNRNPSGPDVAWGGFSDEDIRNVLEIKLANRGTQLSESGTFTVAGVSYEYIAPLSLEGFVAGLRNALQTQLGVPVTAHPNRPQSERAATFQDASMATGWHVVIGRARNVQIGGNGDITAPGVVGKRVEIGVGDMPLQDVASLIHAVRDDVPRTIDVVVVGERSLHPLPPPNTGTQGGQPWAKGFSDARVRYGLTNAVVADSRAVSSPNSHVHDIAHELGHVLYGNGHANEDNGIAGVDARSPDVDTHLMSLDPMSTGQDNVRARKRLNEGYSINARQRGRGGLEPVLFPAPPSSPRPAPDQPFSSLTPPRP